MAKGGGPGTPTLFGGRIEHVTSVMDDHSVPIDNSSDATYSISGDGRRWVRKPVMNTGVEPLLAEAVGLLLGKELHVPMPRGAVHGAGNDASWLSEVIPSVLHWNPIRTHFIRNPEGFGRMLTLDAILFNEDRHAGNILLQPTPTPLDLRVWSIDMGRALVGHPEDFERVGLSSPDVRNLARGLPIDLLSEGAYLAAAEARGLAAGLVRGIVQEACDLAREPQVARIFDALMHRLAHAPTVVDDYLSKIRAMP
jgi:hypothetical protein